MSTSNAEKPPICVSSPLGTRSARAASDGPEGVVEATVVGAAHRSAIGTAVHWTFLALALVVLGASMMLGIRDGRHVVLPVTDTSLPGTCTFRKLTGVPCPGCGLTRSFISMGHGRIAEAWRYNPAGLFFFAVVLFQIPYRFYQLARIRRGRVPHRFLWLDQWVLVALVLTLIVQWICSLAGQGI